MQDRNPYAKRVDKNQNQLVKDLRSCGVKVSIISMCGMGTPDILCLYHGLWTPIEIKGSDKDKLTEMEEAWWSRTGLVPHIAWDLESAAKWIPELEFSSQGNLKMKGRKKNVEL